MEQYHGTTIISVRRNTPQGLQLAIGGDGQVTLGNIVVKGTARKVRKLYKDQVLAGFALPARRLRQRHQATPRFSLKLPAGAKLQRGTQQR